MNPEHLHALVIDRHFDELTPEVTALLDAYLATHPNAQHEADDIIASLALAGRTLELHPELARVTEPDAFMRPPTILGTARSKWAGLAIAASIALVAAMSGFYAGSQKREPTAAVNVPPSEIAKQSGPWARYRMVADPRGLGMQVVRVDKPEQKGEMFQ